MPPWLRPSPRLLLALLLLELVACVGDLLLGPYGHLHWEELFNARSGVHIACGHEESAFDLQYRTFCGGCTAEAVLAAPLFTALGPTTLVWKIVPLFFHLVITAAGAGLLLFAGDPADRERRYAGALTWVLLLMAAPGYYRELALMGWGNHAECSAFPLSAALLLALATHRRWFVQAPLLLLAGGLTGLGLWFGHTSAYAAPALALGALVVGRWLSPLFAAGGALGLVPLYLYHKERAPAAAFEADWVANLHLSPPDRLFDWLFGDYLRWGLWLPEEFGERMVGNSMWYLGLWLLALVGLGRALRSAFTGPLRAAALYGPACLLGLLAAYVLRYDLWMNLPDPLADATFNLRYRIPLFPVLAMGAALTIALPRRDDPDGLRLRDRLLFPALLGALLLYGLVSRLGQWEGPRPALFEQRVFRHGGWADMTVPSGEPPQRRIDALGRPADVTAALRWIGAHEDPLPDCRLAHLFELGRRLGIGLDGAVGADLSTYLSPALALAPAAEQRRLLADGVGRRLTRPDDQLDPALAERLDALHAIDPAFAAEVAAAAGRIVEPGHKVSDEPASLDALDPRVRAGVCEARGLKWVQGRTAAAAWREVPLRITEPVDPAALQAHAGLCLDHPAFADGVGRGFASAVGCESDALALLRDELPGKAEAEAGWAMGCLIER